jgi:hypothetical protein
MPRDEIRIGERLGEIGTAIRGTVRSIRDVELKPGIAARYFEIEGAHGRWWVGEHDCRRLEA